MGGAIKKGSDMSFEKPVLSEEDSYKLYFEITSMTEDIERCEQREEELTQAKHKLLVELEKRKDEDGRILRSKTNPPPQSSTSTPSTNQGEAAEKRDELRDEIQELTNKIGELRRATREFKAKLYYAKQTEELYMQDFKNKLKTQAELKIKYNWKKKNSNKKF